MRLVTLRDQEKSSPAVCVDEGRGVLPISRLLSSAAHDLDLLGLLHRGELDALAAELAAATAAQPTAFDVTRACPLFRHPNKLLGVGLNYRAHAGDLDAEAPRSSPASFLKGNHTIIGPGDTILVPGGIGTVTAEAELGLVIGRTCYRVGVEEALGYVAGITAVLDQTAESVLRQNPRYLTRSKNYPTFLSFGPVLITLDEVLRSAGSLAEVEVRTIKNGSVVREDRVANMMFSPAELVSFHSYIMPLYPGDLLSTGTPGATPIVPGDEVRCELVGLTSLANPVGAGSDPGELKLR